MKKSPKKIPKQSKQPISKLQRKLWELCKQITRKTHGNSCYTCTANSLTGSNWQTGHMIPKATCGALLKYDLRVLRPQCFHCNINLGGQGAEFLRKMLVREGQEYVDKIFADKRLPSMSGKEAYSHYELLIAKYELILEEL